MEDYPKSLTELEKRFASDEACRDYLFNLRWQNGFSCPKCGGGKMWPMNNGLILCASCRHQISILQGTVFQDSHLPLITWFRVTWYICVQKNGTSALGLQRALGLGSYRTAWMCLHKLRHSTVRPQREKLSGAIEVDETYVGGKNPANEAGARRARLRLKGIRKALTEYAWPISRMLRAKSSKRRLSP